LALAWAVSGFTLGSYSDRRGNRKLILILSVVGFSLCTALSGAAVSFITLLLVRIVMGLFEGPVLPIAQSVMAAESSPERRGFNMGLLQNAAGCFLSLIIGPPLTAMLATTFGWRDAFYIISVPGLIMAVLLWLFMKKHSATVVEGGAQPTATAKSLTVRELLGFRNVWLGIPIACCLVTWLLVLLTFAPVYLMRVRALSAPDMGFVMALIGCGAVLWGFVVPYCSDRFGRKPAIVVFSIVSAIAPLVLAFMPGTVFWLGAAAFATFFAVGCFPLVMATVPSETVPAGSVASALGLIMGLAEIVGGVLAPTLSGVGADAVGLYFPFVVSASGALLAGLLSMFLVETAPKRTKPAKAAPRPQAA
jgi:predicted MFS family arabinose efflux permease